MFAHHCQRDRSGRPSCAITQHRSGLATSYRSRISSFDRSQAFVIIELSSRRVIHAGVTRSPTDPWVAQQLREATPYGQAPTYLIRDNDSKFGPCFARVAATSAIETLKIPFHAPRANAVCERFLRSVRQECLDHLLIFHEKQLQRVRNRVCGILQSSTTASRYSAANSRIVWITWFLSVQGNQGDCSSDLSWATP
jgi:hypothetical protein